MNLWDNRESIKITTSLKSYLYTSVKNGSLNFIKRESFFSVVDDFSDQNDRSVKTPDKVLEESERRKMLHNAINELPEKCRQIFIMCKFDNLSYNEIAEIQNISINTVKTQLRRAVKTLAKNLAHLRSVIIFVQFFLWWYFGK